jgi:hypothetical protein
MAAAITTSATTLEAQCFEVLKALDTAERTYNNANPTATKNQVSVSLDAENGTISVSAQFQATVGGTAGTITLTPSPYLP